MPPAPDGSTSLFIAGGWSAAAEGGRREILNPFDGSVIATVAEGSAADADRAVRAARAAFDEGSWARSPAALRAGVLTGIADSLVEHREDLARLETLDTGKTLAESRFDVDDTVSVFRYYAALATSDAGRTVDTGRPGALSRVVHEPVGVCALITPWNYPLLQISWKLAPALAAGNTVVAKPSELTPLTTIRLFELLQDHLEDAGAPHGTTNLVLGGGAVGAALAEHPDVDLVSFTGGPVSGRSVMRAAAETVKRVALELGGKNPNIVFPDVDLDTAVDFALTAAFLHSGQVCSAGSRLLLHRSLHTEFTRELARRAELIRIGDGTAKGTESGPLISAEHRARVEQHIARALADGAVLRAGGGRPTEPELQAGYFLRPTVLDGCSADMAIVREEVFGPVLTIEVFDDEDEAVALANDTPYGLAGAVWTGDVARGERVASRLRLGTVWINDYHPYVPQAEWGGFKQSGTGRELGPSGLREYQETKHVWRTLDPEPQRWFAG
jgi:betaine-aldehyde dehydrogenase